ncbi:MAG TPA: ATP-binding protein, partial [Deinococcales bacterium]|nr:ATP-binding protein [Deinococcales bacterium]
VVAGAGVALRLTRPLERLARGAARLEAGEYGLRLAGEGRDEFGRLTRAFNSLSAGLSREQAARRAMVADIAHDLRTPVSVLRSRLEALQDGVVTPGPAVVAGLIDQTLLLGRLVEDLRTLSLADVNALDLHPEPLDVTAFLEALVPAWPGVRLALPAPGLAVTADRARLAQALGNLLANAAAHGAPPVEVGAAAEGRGARFWVRDHGPGLPAGEEQAVFERFRRLDPARGRSGGSGLGLAIVKALAQAHGGRVEAANAPGGGAGFTLHLPG